MPVALARSEADEHGFRGLQLGSLAYKPPHAVQYWRPSDMDSQGGIYDWNPRGRLPDPRKAASMDEWLQPKVITQYIFT